MSYESLSVKLNAIETELRRLGFMPSDSVQAIPVRSAFGANEMPFEHWLSDAFLPSARNAIAERNLPTISQVGIAAIRNFDGNDEAETLVALLCEFDREVERVSKNSAVKDR